MTKLRLPGLIDAHVHLREPGYIWLSLRDGGRIGGRVTVVLEYAEHQSADGDARSPERQKPTCSSQDCL